MTDVRLTALNPVDSQVYPVACNDKGELLLEANQASGNLDVQGDLTVTGTGTFVNGAAEIQGQGFFVGTGFVSYKMAASSYAIHDDDINWKYSVYYNGTTHIGGYITTADPAQDTPNIALNADGSATFTGTIAANTSGAAFNLNRQNINGPSDTLGIFAAAGVTKHKFVADGSVDFSGSVFAGTLYAGEARTNSDGLPGIICSNNGPLSIKTGLDEAFSIRNLEGTQTVRIGVNGSATFNDGAVCGSSASSASDYGVVAYSNATTNGALYARNFNVAGRNYIGANPDGQTTSYITGTGNAFFAGNVTAQNITFRLSDQVVAEMPAPLVDDGFAAEREIDLLSELIKMKAEIENLNAFMQKTIQDSPEIEQ